VFALWLIVVSVRAVGAVADAEVRNRSVAVHTAPNVTSHALEIRRRFLGDGNETICSVCRLVGALEEFA